MTAVAVGQEGPQRPLPVPVVLGLHEGLRIVRHPLSLVGLALLLLFVGLEHDDGPRDAFEVITAGPTFFQGVFVYFAAHLVASRDRRADSGELLAALPVPAVGRVAGLCVAALVPALVSLTLVLTIDTYNSARDAYAVAPSVWHLVQGPLTVLGGALLGIMVARLSALPGTALLVMVAMLVANAWLSEEQHTLHTLATYVPWAVWGDHDGWAGLHPGSPGWHAAYLAALCAMAATGAFLRDAVRTWRVLAVGAGCTAVAVLTGSLQLP